MTEYTTYTLRIYVNADALTPMQDDNTEDTEEQN